MDIVCSFGRSVDVDGDEWIDLGPPSAPCEAARPGGVQHDDESNNPFAFPGTSKARTHELKRSRESSEPLSEPEPEQALDEAALQEVAPAQVPKKPAIDLRPQKAKISAPAPVSKAAKSREALVSFYLGRAKRMEAKRKQIAGSPPKPTGLSALINIRNT